MSILENIQTEIRLYLQTELQNNGLNNQPVTSFLKSDLGKRLEMSIESHIDFSVVVMPPLPRKIIAHAPGPRFEEIEVKIRIFENITTRNDQSPNFLTTAEKISNLMHCLILKKDSWAIRLEHPEMNPWTIISERNFPNVNILELEFLATYMSYENNN